MAQEVVWSHEAIADLEAVADYIARDSPSYAAAFIQETLDTGRSLSVLSRRGRIVPELGNPSIREVFVRDYRLIYSIGESRVVVLGLIHGRRDLKRLWEKEKRKMGGVWRGVKISDKDIKKARHELLSKLEEKW